MQDGQDNRNDAREDGTQPVDTAGVSGEPSQDGDESGFPERLTGSETGATQEPSPGLLPDGYDRLVPAGQLARGPNNPRQEQPSDALQRSVASDGLIAPLIVWEDTDRQGDVVYQITDGWQRYQAAIKAGWEYLPIRVCDESLGAMNRTATRSEVDKFSTYHWARLCQNIASELGGIQDGNVERETIEKTAQMVNRTPQTVRKYLAVLSLPEIIHVLLRDGPVGNESDWAALQNHNAGIRRYNGLCWKTAHHLARQAEKLDHTRVLGVAATVVTFDDPAEAREYIALASEQPEVPLETLQKQVRFGHQECGYVQVPQTAVQLDAEKKKALLGYCHEQRQSLSSLIEQYLIELSDQVLSK